MRAALYLKDALVAPNRTAFGNGMALEDAAIDVATTENHEASWLETQAARHAAFVHAAFGEERKLADRLQVHPVTVGQLRRRFIRDSLQELHDALRSGRPLSIRNERIALLIRKTLRTAQRGVVVRWPHRHAFPKIPCTVSGGPSVCNRTGSVTSNCPTIHFLWKRWEGWSGYT